MLRDYLNGTQAFQNVAKEMQMKESGLRRLVSPVGNPTLKNFFRLIKICKDKEGLEDIISKAA